MPLEKQTPWGKYVVLESFKNHKVKRLEVKPGHRTSLQKHRARQELWNVVEGTGLIFVDNGTDQVISKTVFPGDQIYIGREVAHRLGNAYTVGQDVVVIEVQIGLCCDENDIERLADDYGRV